MLKRRCFENRWCFATTFIKAVKNVIFFLQKKMYMACYILQASITKPYNSSNGDEKKKVKRGSKKKNVDSRKKGYFTRATTTSSSCRQMSFFFGQSTKGIFGCTSESFVCKKDWVENASSYQPFPSFQWFEPLNVFLTFFLEKICPMPLQALPVWHPL